MIPYRSHPFISDSLHKVAPFFTHFIHFVSLTPFIPFAQNGRSLVQIVRNKRATAKESFNNYLYKLEAEKIKLIFKEINMVI